MAPDLNSVPASPRVLADSQRNPQVTPSPSASLRRTTSSMPPPPVPHSMPTSPRPQQAPIDNTGVGMGPGPLRHPRPLTAAELHLELEKEQESIVNRLTRELSALRAQTASVASTASSASDLFSTTDPYPYASNGANSIIPTSTRRHRSSSNLSQRSSRSVRDTLASTTNTSVSGVAAPRDQSVQSSTRPSIEIARPDMSRQNSTSATGFRSASLTTSPMLPHSHRQSISSTTQHGLVDAESGQTHAKHYFEMGRASNVEDAAKYKAELESAKKENEDLRLKIKELQAQLKRTESS